MTEADLAALARGADLKLADTADAGKLADDVTEAFRRYVIWHRAERAEASPSEVQEWARGLHRWAADGLVMLGGGLDSETGADDFPPRAAAGMQLVHGWPADDEQLRCDYLTWIAAGPPDFSDRMSDSPSISDVIRRCVAAVELIQILAAGVAERAASHRRTGRPREYERRELIKSLADAYRRLHRRKPTFARSLADGGREGLPTGPALDWLRGVLDLVADRSSDPVIRELATWGRRPDTIAELLRKMS